MITFPMLLTATISFTATPADDSTRENAIKNAEHPNIRSIVLTSRKRNIGANACQNKANGLIVALALIEEPNRDDENMNA